VDWVDDVCAALVPFLEFTEEPPPTAEDDSPALLIQNLSGYLGAASAQAGTTITDIQAVGPGPARYSDVLLTDMLGALTSIQDVFDGVKADVDAIDETDPGDILTRLPPALEPLDTIQNLPDPTKALQVDPELSAAADQAPTCQTIGGL
jgi:hypothetical protein